MLLWCPRDCERPAFVPLRHSMDCEETYLAAGDCEQRAQAGQALQQARGQQLWNALIARHLRGGERVLGRQLGCAGWAGGEAGPRRAALQCIISGPHPPPRSPSVALAALGNLLFSIHPPKHFHPS